MNKRVLWGILIVIMYSLGIYMTIKVMKVVEPLQGKKIAVYGDSITWGQV